MGRFMALFVVLCAAAACRAERAGGRQERRARLGGPCDYAEYPGEAAIVSVEQTERSREQKQAAGGPGYEGYEIRFRFTPASTVEPEWARRAAERDHIFQLANSWYPGPRYLEKYGITEGKRYSCTLQVITRGTCTPILFDIAGLPRDDYFESGR